MQQLGSTSRGATRLLRSPAALAAVAYVALTIALTYPLSVHPATTTFPPGSDLNLYVWTLAWDAHALLHHPLAIFDANIFYPYERTLAYSENLIGAAVLVSPIEWLLQQPLLAMNVAALLTIPLSALGAFVLARRLDLGTAAAWICGLVYGFAPPRFLRLDQAHLTAVEWIPFCLAFTHTYVRTGRKRDLRLAIAFLSAQAITSGHGAVFLLLALALFGAARLAAGARPAIVRAVRDAGVPGALLLAPAVLVFIPYRLAQNDVGLRRVLSDWTGSWASFLSSPTHVDGFILDHLGTLGAYVNANTQAYLFPGFLPLALAATAFVPRLPITIRARMVHVTRCLSVRSDVRVYYLLLVLACALLAIGPPYGPWRFLYALPGLSFIRVPSRFMILAMLGIGVLCGFGFERLTNGSSRRRQWMAAGLIGTALVAEFAVVPFDVAPSPVVIPAADRWLNDQPKPFVVAELPPMDPTIPMLHAMEHWQKTVHGYSGWNPPRSQQIEAALARVPAPDSLDLLAQVGVTYLVVHSAMYPPGEWAAMEERLNGCGPGLQLRYRDAESRVYAVAPAASGADQAPGSTTSTRSWQPSSRVSVDPGSTSAGRKPTGD